MTQSSASADKIYGVIGSGPAGIAAASALLKSGIRVVMLDSGIKIELEKSILIDRMSGLHKTKWSKQDIELVKSGNKSSARGIDVKTLFGSDFPYRDSSARPSYINRNTKLTASRAIGGFSNVWGGAIMPYRSSDIDNWPISLDDLDKHYDEVVKITGITAIKDDLSSEFSIHSNKPGFLKLSSASDKFIKILNAAKSKLNKDGWIWGQSRLAVKANSDDKDFTQGCSYCGLCMHGCPYNHIYNSATTLEEFKLNPLFTYIDNVLVTSMQESEDSIKVLGQHRVELNNIEYSFTRVFLGAGVLGTAQIILKSERLYNTPLILKDSQFFLVPFISFKTNELPSRDSTNTLSEIFIELKNKDISPRSIHLQLYACNDILSNTIENIVGPFKFLSKLITPRITLVLGYLHSDDSAEMLLTLKNDKDTDYLEILEKPSKNPRKVISRINFNFLKNWFNLGGFIVTPLLKIAKIGASFHNGASFPMAQASGQFKSDLMGRPYGWKRVHIVDASVLPSIPGTTITLTVMANSHRIGTLAAELD